MKAILAAVDLSDASQQVLTFAETLAKALGAKLSLLHIIEPVASYAPLDGSMDLIETVPPPLLPEDIKPYEDRLAKLAEKISAHGVQTESHAVFGMAADEIVQQATDLGASLIILGSHGHGALYHLFAGSVVTGVLKRTEIPVTVVPIPKVHDREAASA